MPFDRGQRSLADTMVRNTVAMKNHEMPISSSLADPSPEQEFDPLLEIKRLRRELSERLERLRPSIVRLSESSETTMIDGEESGFQSTDTRQNESTLSHAACENVSVEKEEDERRLSSARENRKALEPEQLIEHLEYTSRLVATLQESQKGWEKIDIPEKSGDKTQVDGPSDQENKEEVRMESVDALNRDVETWNEIETKDHSLDISRRADFSESAEHSSLESLDASAPNFAEKIAKSWLSVLKGLNSGLAWIGLLGIVCGIAYHLRGETGSTQIGLPIMILGTFLIVIGLSGRFAQEFLNRRTERRDLFGNRQRTTEIKVK